SVPNIKEALAGYLGRGFSRVMLKGMIELHDIETVELPKFILPDEIFVLVDRLAYRYEKETLSRLFESVEAAFDAGQGKAVVRNLTSGKKYSFSNLFECAACDIPYNEPEPRLFSFNYPFGACPSCQGFGRTVDIDESLVIPDKSKSIEGGAIQPFNSERFLRHLNSLLSIAFKNNIPTNVPFQSLTKEQEAVVWNGVGRYIGINGFFKMVENKSYKMAYRVLMSRYRGYTKCKACNGSRLRTSARQVFVGGKNIPELIEMPLENVAEFIKNLKLTKHDEAVAGQILTELKRRLALLVDIGLEYLTLSRLNHTLSGGESQRINLATALGSTLVGTLYVLDEPSIGLHPRDTERLLRILFRLRNLGNTILVVEHDPDIIQHADMIIDIGPAAGKFGGELIYAGSPDKIHKCKESITGQYMSGAKQIQFDANRSKGSGKKIVLHKPRKYNLDIKKVEFPLGCMTVVTGVSGSGKSTLVHDILYIGLKKDRGMLEGSSANFEKLEGTIHVDFVEMVDQSSIGKSSRSTPATFTKAFDAIRELYSKTQSAKQMGWKLGYFSFNVPGGRCEVCEGAGSVTVDMQFLPDVHLECEVCGGTRYKKETRHILHNGKSIVDVLNMTVDEAIDFFAEESRIIKKLLPLQEVGLGYLQLGQPSTMLSGGEAQRIKLASHLEAKKSTDTVFMFDEPTTGLHLDDISKLLKCFRRLTERGHTVIIIEHNMHVIASADHVIDMGPEAGARGGKIMAVGTPEQIAKSRTSHTGRALKEFFG
ncbi:MAG: excinuclease ABC subunit UvrA, partial [Chlorobi bacterium]|nr:excinuclease ABC subunit UvrA [Chlorobiota bacterium]